MTISKTAVTVTTLAFVGLFGGGIFLFTQAGTIVKGFLERTATATLGVPVSIDSLQVNLKDKTALLQGLRIDNVDGFDKPHVLYVDKIGAQLGAVSKDLVVIKEISVAGTDINLEIKEQGSNVTALKRGIKVKPRAKVESETAASDSAGEAKATPPKVIIDLLTIGEVAVHPSASVVDGYEISRDVTVPKMVLRDIGRSENGVIAEEAVAQVMQALMTKVNAAAAEAGLSPEALFKSVAEDKLDSVKETLKGKLDSLF